MRLEVEMVLVAVRPVLLSPVCASQPQALFRTLPPLEVCLPQTLRRSRPPCDSCNVRCVHVALAPI